MPTRVGAYARPKTTRPSRRLSAKDVATAIDVPTSDWEGNCHGIAHAMLEAGLVEGKLRYGIWWGRIDPRSVFRGRPFTHHGWIELPDGIIIDPTRWVFEGKEPYIWTGKNRGEYDFGGNRLLAMQRTFPPTYVGSKDVQLALCNDTRGFLRDLLGNKDYRIDIPQAFWLANLPLKTLDDNMTRELYQALVSADFGALIPIDNRREVLGAE